MAIESVKLSLTQQMQIDRSAGVNPQDAVKDKSKDLPKVPAQPTPEVGAFEPKQGEVLFEPACPNMPVHTAFADGKSVSLPYITSDEEEISFLRSFADHCGIINTIEGT